MSKIELKLLTDVEIVKNDYDKDEPPPEQKKNAAVVTREGEEVMCEGEEVMREGEEVTREGEEVETDHADQGSPEIIRAVDDKDDVSRLSDSIEISEANSFPEAVEIHPVPSGFAVASAIPKPNDIPEAVSDIPEASKREEIESDDQEIETLSLTDPKETKIEKPISPIPESNLQKTDSVVKDSPSFRDRVETVSEEDIIKSERVQSPLPGSAL